jgi:integral membrane sensor domain MASE1
MLGFFLHPLFFLAGPRLVSGFLPLASTGSGIILHRGHMLHSVSSIREIFASLVMVVVPVLILVRLDSWRRVTRNCRLHWISQRVDIFHPHHLGQGGWHVSL